MKKVFTLIAGVVLGFGAFAQQVPNGSFEVWDSVPGHTYPHSWSTFDNIAFPGVGGVAGFAFKDTSHFVGQYSLKLVTGTIPTGPTTSILAPSFAGLGAGIYSQGISFTGIAYTKRVDTIFYAAKYNPATPSDTALMLLNLKKNGVSITGGTIYLAQPTTNGAWRYYYFPLEKNTTHNYTDLTTTPDTLQLSFISSSDTSRSTVGSALYIDALSFDVAVEVVNGISDLDGKVLGVKVYPNPAVNQLNIAVEESEVGSLLQLFDMQGREVYNGIIERSTMVIDTKTFATGAYAIHVASVDKITKYKGLVNVAH